MPTSASGLPHSYHVNPSDSASGSDAPSRPGRNRKNPLSFLIEKEITVANRVVWIASSAWAHQGPATIHATARRARARTERTDRISNLRMRLSLALRPRCVTGSGCSAADNLGDFRALAAHGCLILGSKRTLTRPSRFARVGLDLALRSAYWKELHSGIMEPSN